MRKLAAGVADAVRRGDPSPANADVGLKLVCFLFFWSPGLSQDEGKMHRLPKGAAGDSAVF